MRRVITVAHRLGEIITEILEARVPMCVWLDSTTLYLSRTPAVIIRKRY